MGVEFYYLQISPPSRAVWMVLEALNVPYVTHVINILKDEHKTPEYTQKINPNQKIPAIKDGDLCLSESRAIAAYLCNKYGSDNRKMNLYPQEAKARAIIDMHLYLDVGFYDTVMVKYLNILGVVGHNEDKRDQYLGDVHKIVKAHEEFLTKHRYIAANHLTLADIFSYVTIGLLDLVDYDLTPYPKICAWKKKMSELSFHKTTCDEPLSHMIEVYQGKLKALKA